jgi:hypothetical protein
MATPVRLHFDALLTGVVPGPTGPAGPTGPTGATGPKGDTGNTGSAGAAGTTPLIQILVGEEDDLEPNSISIVNGTGSRDYDLPSGAANPGAMIVVCEGTNNARAINFAPSLAEEIYGVSGNGMTGAGSSRTFIAREADGSNAAGWLCVSAAGA